VIAIGLCVDRSYFVPALVTLVSLADSHDTATLRNMSVRILSPDITHGEAGTFETVVRRLGFRSFCCRRIVPPSDLVIVNGDYISTATYLRFAFEEAFVGEPYLLYLDADILVTGDMTAPFNGLRKDAVGAVRDQLLHTVGTEPALPGLVSKYPDYRDEPYFNAGALWLPTTGLRTINEGARRAAIDGHEHIYFNDQDALNMWFLNSHSCAGVPVRFNQFELGRFLEESDWITSVVRAVRHDVGTSALHFVGPDKPWLRKCPGTESVRLYSRALRVTRGLISRARDGTLDVVT
jgi:lipopolysaccharide biosynthesis glycosyltransferase